MHTVRCVYCNELVSVGHAHRSFADCIKALQAGLEDLNNTKRELKKKLQQLEQDDVRTCSTN